MTTIDRRQFLTRTAAVGGGALAGSAVLGRLAAHGAWAAPTAGSSAKWNGDSGYGALRRRRSVNRPELGELLALPDGFRYWVVGVLGETMSDGTPTPRNHDGMGAFAYGHDRVRLIRNHEVRNAAGNFTLGVLAPGEPAAPNPQKYDPLAMGGTVTLEVAIDRTGGGAVRDVDLVRDFVSAAGTIVNCAGGEALGDIGWITCEETIAGTSAGWGAEHGYCFLVPVDANGITYPTPLRDMGRFAHEAVAVDPTTGIVYETEDAGSSSGFYRFTPSVRGDLSAGGTLEMLAVAGAPNYDTRTGETVGVELPVAWVPIAQPDSTSPSPYQQGSTGGGARFNRLEGIWWSDDRFFFTSTSGGDAQHGPVWAYVPAREKLMLVYESPGIDAALGRSPLDSPDNLNVTPRGGIILCEDDSGAAVGGADDTHPLAPGITDVNRLIGLDRDGRPFEFAVNVLNDAEFAGACWAPNAPDVLFVNNFGTGAPGSGMTFAVTGPWERGAL